MTAVTSVRGSLRGLVESLRLRIVSSATSPFGHAPYPLARSLDYQGDPGLLGPGSISWLVLGDAAAFVGGIRGLLIQAAHPEVVAGVGDHSRYREDPLGRLSRTSAYVTATTYGAMPEVEHAVAQVRRVHRIVSGVSSRGVPYDAADPAFSAWVHNALTESFLVAHRHYGGVALSAAEEDAFVVEQTRIGALLGSDPMPDTSRALSHWIANHPAAAPSPEMREALAFLVDPPLEPGLLIGYKMLFEAAVATVPRRIRDILEVTRTPGAVSVGRAAVAGLRWALGSSPSWQLALVRTGADVPEGRFKQPLPVQP
ncbi:MAG TPA: oxygenase MpaB family protein [Acidimicrobiia bacterium]|nr:oxygenase MpaB family protein [Acidimicrobiia bacterium]